MSANRFRRSPNTQIWRALSLICGVLAVGVTIALIAAGYPFLAVVYGVLGAAFAVRWWWIGRQDE